VVGPSKSEPPFQAEAYNLAMAELAREAVNRPEVVDVLLGAVLDLAAAGQTDVEALAHYATAEGISKYHHG
jgi:hypothetical protein